MHQIHIKLDDNLHDQITYEAEAGNYSLQEYVVNVLRSNLKEEKKVRPPFHIEKARDFSFIDLFAGIGGIRLAFEQNGGECLFSSEWDRYAQKTYRENFGEIPAGDITGIDPQSIPDHDILAGGFPCQPFSIAGVSKKNSLGRKHGFLDETQGTLFFNIVQILKAKRPKAFLLENVKNLKSHDQGKTFKVITGALAELDYVVFHQVMDARDYVPQHRERIFMVGFDRRRYGDFINFSFPQRSTSETPVLASVLQRAVDEKYTLSDKLWNYLQEYAAKHQAKGNGFGFGLNDRNSVARTLSARYYKDGSEILIDQGRNKNPRRLTPRECARLMGYPDSFVIPVSDTQAYRQFGNSVAVPLVSAIASEIRRTLMHLERRK